MTNRVPSRRQTSLRVPGRCKESEGGVVEHAGLGPGVKRGPSKASAGAAY